MFAQLRKCALSLNDKVVQIVQTTPFARFELSNPSPVFMGKPARLENSQNVKMSASVIGADNSHESRSWE
jgi:hypothetical protein